MLKTKNPPTPSVMKAKIIKYLTKNVLTYSLSDNDSEFMKKIQKESVQEADKIFNEYRAVRTLSEMKKENHLFEWNGDINIIMDGNGLYDYISYQGDAYACYGSKARENFENWLAEYGWFAEDATTWLINLNRMDIGALRRQAAK